MVCVAPNTEFDSQQMLAVINSLLVGDANCSEDSSGRGKNVGEKRDQSDQVLVFIKYIFIKSM